jgi:D-alanine-D-alanine ligase
MSSSLRNTVALNHNTRIGVLYGGLSSEREVSLRSGKNCFDALQRLGYHNTLLIDAQPDIARVLADEKIELAYIALHGQYGEDGCIQGLLEWLGIPYTGCGVTASALCMNKALTKTILKAAGLPVIESWVVRSGEAMDLPVELTYPVMVKPLCEGSSIGMSKVDTSGQLMPALEEAFKHSQVVMIETYVPGKSLTVGVIEINGELTVTPILELRPNCSEWYDLKAKYTEGGTTFILPAELDNATTVAIQQATLAAFIAMDCQGVARVDFVCDAANRFYILEINTLPGMTNLSDLPAQAKTMGIQYDALVEAILKTACQQPMACPAK